MSAHFATSHEAPQPASKFYQLSSFSHLKMKTFTLSALAVVAACSVSAGVNAADPVLSVSVGTQPQLNDIAGLVNKNTVMKNNNVAIASSSVAAVQDDTISIKEADGDLPIGVWLTGEQEPITEALDTEADIEQGVAQRGRRGFRRQGFCFRRGPTTVCGWRYPMDFWFRRGRFIYGRSCPFGQAFGGYFYC